ncbi:MAG: ribonuclease J [Oligoflexia bacterium]|nr:ribonuclease J [Oligoflexia bacterium]
MSADTKLRVIPLGGLGEVGLNCMAIECNDEILIIDCGVLFPDLHWLGLDLVVPKFDYLIENKHKIKGLVVTHGHEDHIGAIPFLLREVEIPIIYASRFASRLIQEKCSEYGVLKRLLTHDVKAGDKVPAGSFEIEFIHVTHSTLQTFALAIHTPSGLIIHSGDFKFDETPYDGPPSDKARFLELGREKPILLLSDSTNSERDGHCPSESSLQDDLLSLIKTSPGAVVVALFASNVHRVHQLCDIAKECGRKVFLSGRSMERYVKIAIEEGLLPINTSLLYPLEELAQTPRHEILLLSTGSQGEARSSLFRLARNENPYLKLNEGDTVILSSRHIPGNERAINFVVNHLFKLGATVHYEGTKNVHVSGHAYRGEQLDLLKMVRPKFFIPVHGEYRHLVIHARTARASGAVSGEAFVVENGQVWEWDGDHVKMSDSIAAGRKWIFRGEAGDLDGSLIKERRAAARGGIVVVDCLTDRRQTQLLKDPQVSFRGFLGGMRLEPVMKESIIRDVTSAFLNWYPENPDGLTREQAIALAVRRVFRKSLDSKPLVIVSFLISERS